MPVTCFLITLSFASRIVGSPIPSTTKSQARPHPASLIFVALAILAALAILSIIKHFYSKKRRAGIPHTSDSQTSSAYCQPFPSLANSKYRSSIAATEFAHRNSADTVSTNEKNAYILGLFGSPTWETQLKLKSEVNSASLSNDRQSTSQLHTQFRHHHSWVSQNALDISCNNSVAPNGLVLDDDICETVRVSKASNFHQQCHPGETNDPHPQSQYLPSGMQDWLSPSEMVKKHGTRSSGRSGRISNSQRPKTSGKRWQSDASMRLVDNVRGTEATLPLSLTSKHNSSSASLPNVFQHRLNLQWSLNSERPSCSGITNDPFSSAANASSIILPNPSLVHISRPYSLAAKDNKIAFKVDETGGLLCRSRDSRLYQELLPVLKPLDVFSSTAKINQMAVSASPDFQVPRYQHNTPQPPSPIIRPLDPNSNSHSLSMLHFSEPILSSSTISPSVTVIRNRSKQQSKSKTPSRSKRISSAGPSPLRTMILPNENTESDTASIHLGGKENNTSHNCRSGFNAQIISDEQETKGDIASSDIKLLFNSFNARSSRFGEFSSIDEEAKSCDTSKLHISLDKEALRASIHANDASTIISYICEDSASSSAQDPLGLSKEIDIGLEGPECLNQHSRDTLFVDYNNGAAHENAFDFVSFWEEADRLEQEDLGYDFLIIAPSGTVISRKSVF